MSLETYRQKRDFEKTAEPRGQRRKSKGFSYVIQKHAASHLHYDFRLELDGVLLSWAVPKGPSLDPKVKRLAMQTEDHPVDYGGFEGIIPEGEYGGGTVMVWDYGTWEPDGDPRAAYDKGQLTFTLHGQKLRGAWHLVLTRRGEGAKKSWLLFKGTDEFARPSDGAIIDEQPDSAKTGRSLEAIARDAGAVWRSKRAARSKPTSAKTSAKNTSKRVPARATPRALDPGSLTSARRVELPSSVEPELATLVSAAPVGDEWLHELKFDGYRLLVRVAGHDVTVTTRNGNDWTNKFGSLARDCAALGLEGALFDGEAVVLGETGVSDFQLLQNALSAESDAQITYYAFDILYLNGYDLRASPLVERKELLRRVLESTDPEGRIRFSDHVLGNGTQFFERACAMGLEGIVSKRKDRPYQGGRSHDWLKVKCLNRQEFVIGGYTEPSGARAGLGALLLGARRDGELAYVGKVGTGFTRRSLQELHDALAPLARKAPPFANPPRGADARGVHWVEPKLVGEIAFTAFTRDGMLRHPTFRGLRLDKPARDVAIEVAEKKPTKRPAARPTKASSAAGQFRLTNPDRVLYPEQNITKRELFEYYAAVSEWMLPHVVNRPLTLVRCPEGHHKQCFFQRHANDRLPEGVRAIPVKDKSGPADYVTIDDARGLFGLVQLGVLEIHTWGAHADDPERPDLLVFDLDPDPAVAWADVVEAARLVRERLSELELESFVKTTGGKGLHVCVPIARRLEWERAKEFCRRFSERIVRERPDAYVANMSKARRKGKIFIDFFRNSRGATFIAPYSTRARAGAHVAMPLSWDELFAKPSGFDFDVRNAPRRLQRLKKDPWAEITKLRQSLKQATLRALGV